MVTQKYFFILFFPSLIYFIDTTKNRPSTRDGLKLFTLTDFLEILYASGYFLQNLHLLRYRSFANASYSLPISFNKNWTQRQSRIILATTPDPTVRPPSRIAKRKPSSTAMGVIRVISICTLSPGITISTPSGNLMTPVTSVVLK